MIYKTFICQIITPMFITGADNNTPELRSSEFKGLMRFWWRAVKSMQNIETLRKEEGKIFGSTEQKSRFYIKLQSENLRTNQFYLLPHKKKAKLSGFEPGQSFSIMISSFQNLNLIEDILEISLILGGFGKRSRRGFGSVSYKNFENKDNLLKYLLEKLVKFNTNFKLSGAKIQNDSNSSLEYPFIKEIIIGNPTNKYEDLLEKISERSHSYKNNSLGSGNPRMASPIYVSVVKINNIFFPIITVLNSVFPKNYQNYNLGKQQQFIQALLLGGNND